MRTVLRCGLALIAFVVCVVLIRDKSNLIVRAQTSCCANNYCSEPPPSCPSPDCYNVANTCSYYWTCDSPLVVDVKHKGFHLTDVAHGVSFEFYNHEKQHVGWTDPKFGNAWLALDRNGNGKIDDASELFGNDTPQPPIDTPNGFNALTFYDLPENGGNGDGYITAEDKIYSHLLLWTDSNQNGISEPSELQTLAQAGITSISLSYARDNWVDPNGNIFGFRGRDHMNSADYDHQIYDVWLVGTNNK